MMTEAEIKEMHPHAREQLEPPKLEKMKKDSLLESSEGAWSCWHTLSTDSGLQSCESINSYVLSHEVCGFVTATTGS